MQLGVGLSLKQRQRQDTDAFSLKLHLLTFKLINTLYHNFEDKTVEKNWSKTWKKNPEADRLHTVVNSLRSAFPMINNNQKPPFIECYL